MRRRGRALELRGVRQVRHDRGRQWLRRHAQGEDHGAGELLNNLDDDSLKLLVKFDKGIEKKVGAEKKAIRQKMAAEPEEAEEAEGED